MTASNLTQRFFAFAMAAALSVAPALADGGDLRQVLVSDPVQTLTIDQRLRDFDRITLDVDLMSKSARDEGHLTISTKFGSFAVTLVAHDLRPSHFRAEVNGGGAEKTLARAANRTFKGRAVGLRDASARFTIDDDRIEGTIIASDETYFIERAANLDPLAPPDEYVFYRQSDVIDVSPGTCAAILADEVADGADYAKDAVAEADSGTSGIDYRVVDIATEADTEFVSALGGATAANNEILSILNAVEGVYEAELALTFNVVYQHAWTSSDPYSGNGASTVLEQFRGHWNSNYTSIARDVTHMWTGRDMDGSTIGIAYVGVICSSAAYSYGVSQRFSGTAAQKSILTAHELGHNFNGSHSDGQAGCTNTIMGSSVGSGFTFCAYSRNQIGQWVAGHPSCIPIGSGGGGSTLTAPTGLSAVASGTTVNLAWTDTNTAETGFRVERRTGSGAYSPIATVGANVLGYADTGRAQNTTYSYRVFAYNATTTSGYSNVATVTVGGSTGSNLITNGNFENGSASWSQTAGVINSSSATPPFSGSWEATLLGRGFTGSAYVHQAPAFTSGAKTLRFYLRINSAETGTIPYDTLRVRITTATGLTLATLATFSNANEASFAGYTLVTLSVPVQYCVAGNRVRFYATEDSMLSTSFSIDDVSIQ